jgi:hypothetical protein
MLAVQTRNGSRQRNSSGPAPRTVGLLRADPEHPPVGERDVDLVLMVLPLRGDGFHADAGKADHAGAHPSASDGTSKYC